MQISSSICEVFGHFQNLNLLVLLQDLRLDQIAMRTWSTGGQLCPIAHGLPAGQNVQSLNVVGQSAPLEHGCARAARHIGANTAAVLRFVRSWDEQVFGHDWLLQQLLALWEERLVDAVTVQEFLGAGPAKHDRNRVKAGTCRTTTRHLAPIPNR